MKRVFVISLFALLVVSAVAIWNFSYQESYEEAKVESDALKESQVIESEEGAGKTDTGTGPVFTHTRLN